MAALLWFGVGAAVGSAVTKKASTIKSNLTAKGIAQATTAAVLNLSGTAKQAAAGVKAARAERKTA
jgi:hypothetical protein